MSPALRIYSEDDTDQPEMITVPLGEILDPIINAAKTNRAFLADFADDELQIPADLYDVLMAFQRVRASA